MALRFQLLARQGEARLGRIDTPNGFIETPAFMPVGTLGAVKGLGPLELEQAGAQVMLANLYHLSLRPGVERIEELGGLHRFCGWPKPMLTDSGGYQVFSLAGLRRVDDRGVSFKSVVDGSPRRFEPESVVDWQMRMGVDIAMVLDECAPWPVSEAEAELALGRTNDWARRSRDHPLRAGWEGGLFGILQGSFYPRLRERALAELVPLGFDGYAIGGVSVGEDKQLGKDIVSRVAPELPVDKPRYLMGVGTPKDIAHAVGSGVDLFDCVLPSRNARHGFLFTRQGVIRIKNARFADDLDPLDDGCRCPTCARVPRALLHHLFRCGELTAKVMATVHNVRFYLDFLQQLREAVRSGRMAETAAELTRPFGPDCSDSELSKPL